MTIALDIQAEALRRITEREAQVIEAERAEAHRIKELEEAEQDARNEAARVLAEKFENSAQSLATKIEAMREFIFAQTVYVSDDEEYQAAVRVARRLGVPIPTTQPLKYAAIHGSDDDQRELRDFIAAWEFALVQGY